MIGSRAAPEQKTIPLRCGLSLSCARSSPARSSLSLTHTLSRARSRCIKFLSVGCVLPLPGAYELSLNKHAPLQQPPSARLDQLGIAVGDLLYLLPVRDAALTEAANTEAAHTEAAHTEAAPTEAAPPAPTATMPSTDTSTFPPTLEASASAMSTDAYRRLLSMGFNAISSREALLACHGVDGVDAQVEQIYAHFPHMSHPILPIFQNSIRFLAQVEHAVSLLSTGDAVLSRARHAVSSAPAPPTLPAPVVPHAALAAPFAASTSTAKVKKSRFSHIWRPPSLCVFPYVN